MRKKEKITRGAAFDFELDRHPLAMFSGLKWPPYFLTRRLHDAGGIPMSFLKMRLK